MFMTRTSPPMFMTILMADLVLFDFQMYDFSPSIDVVEMDRVSHVLWRWQGWEGRGAFRHPFARYTREL
jgi:hypothetical protein